MARTAPRKHDLHASITNFGALLRYLRQRVQLTQRELALATGYSSSQISRLEQNERLPDEMTLLAVFVPALGKLLHVAYGVLKNQTPCDTSDAAAAIPAPT